MRLQVASRSIAEGASELGVLLVKYSKPGSAHDSQQFGSGHIPPSTSFVGGFSLPSPGLNTIVCSHEGGSGYMNIGSTPYIPSYVPSSITMFLLNVVVMINPPYTL